jgi:hypothetical protein
VFLTVENGAGLAPPKELRVSAFADGASLYTDEQVPRSGMLVTTGTNGELGTLTIYAPDTAAALRIVVAGYASGVQLSEGTTTARLVAGRQVAAGVSLAVFTGSGDASVDGSTGGQGGGDAAGGNGSGGAGGSAGNAGSGGNDAGGAADGGTIDDVGGDAIDAPATDGSPPDMGAICQSSSLAGTSDTPGNVVDLTAEGTQDWRFWGPLGASTFKRTAGNKISDYTLIGSGPMGTRVRNGVTFSWSDGSPTLAQTGAADTMTLPLVVGAGASIMVPASSTARTLSVYVGGINDTGIVVVSLSDGCVPDYFAAATNGHNEYNVVYRLTFKSAVPGAVLRIRWTMSSGYDPIGLYAATLQ